jgi:N-acyl homoserine lactone hydrolase
MVAARSDPLLGGRARGQDAGRRHRRDRSGAFARFEVSPEQELPAALAQAGVAPEAISEVILTHHHGDHVDGLVHVSAPSSISKEELRFTHAAFSRLMRRVLGQPLPDGFAPAPVTLEDGPFGAFASSRRLSADGRIVAVPTPGHTPSHISVICVDDEGRHVFLAGDATDTLEQLRARRADAIGPKPSVSIETMNAILAHGRSHPTVFLPSHDPESVARLESRTVL